MVNPKSMNEILDDSTKFDRLERVINEYWPKFKDDKIGRSEIRKELKIRFKENEIKYIIDELSDRHLTGFKGSDVIRNIETSSTKTGAYLYLVLGIVLIIVGITFGQWNSLMGILGISSNIIFEILAVNFDGLSGFKYQTVLITAIIIIVTFYLLMLVGKYTFFEKILVIFVTLMGFSFLLSL